MELPEDISIHILSRLPVKSLLKFKKVCKSWYSIISSQYFIKKQLNHSQSTLYTQHKNVLGLVIPSWNGSDRCVVYKEISDGILHAKQFSFPFHNKVVEVCNYCDGLICFIMSGHRSILVWNPSLPTEYKIIQMGQVVINIERLSELDKFPVGIGYDSTTDDYKIVRVPTTTTEERFRSRYSFDVEVFSMKSGSWRKKKISENLITYDIQQHMNVYTRNRLHWIGRHYDEGEETQLMIVYFDMVEERLDHVNLPGKTFVHMFDYKDSFAVMDHDAVWVLVEYNGMKSSWKNIFEHYRLKYYMNNIKCDQCCYLTFKSWDVFKMNDLGMRSLWFSYCCFTRDGKILIRFRGHGVKTHDQNDGSIEDVVMLGDDVIDQTDSLGWFYASPYVESLVSPRWL